MSSQSHLWRHFARPRHEDGSVPLMVSGEGAWIYDNEGRTYFDALSALYCVNLGYGRREIVDAMSRQAERLCYFPIWASSTEPAIALAEKIASLAPDGLEYVFFTGGGSESIDAALKLIRQHYRLRGQPEKRKIIARDGAYHGTSLGALSVTGITSLRAPFEPLLSGVIHAPKVDAFHSGMPRLEHSLVCADAIASIVEREGPETVAAIFVEPIQNAGGCLVAEPEYFARLRQICDEYDVLLVSDETICSWGRLGEFFGCQALGYVPDVITTAKGLTSAYAPMGAAIVSEKVTAPFIDSETDFVHGLTFGGHPVACAAALATIDILEREGLCEQSRIRGDRFRQELETLRELPIVGDVRGMALFQAIELVADGASGEPLQDDQLAHLAATVPRAILEAGVICRAFHRSAPVIQFAPPLISEDVELAAVVATVSDVLQDAMRDV